MNKKYEYNGNIYCEDDLSEEIYNYGGDLDDLFSDLLRNQDIEEITYYSAKDACSSDECKELGWLDEEQREETNLDHYKDEILEKCLDSLAVVKGRPKLCYKTSCNDCDFKLVQKECHNKVKDWLKQTHKKPTYKLTQFEYDLLQHFSVDFKFKEMGLLKEMKEKGHFKNINGDELIKDILESCEVIK